MKLNWDKGSLIIWFTVTIFLAIGVFVFKSISNTNNIEQITYKNREYIKSSNQEIDTNMKKSFEIARPTGIYLKSMEVYDVINDTNDSTIIFLKTSDEKFSVYELSGGP